MVAAPIHSLARVLRSCALAGLLTGCASGPPAVLRNSDLMRELFYPPAVPRGELGPDQRGDRFDHAAFASLLKAVLKPGGLVDYARLKRLEPELNLYLVALGEVELDRLSRYEQLALLLNAYNAFTLKMIVENPGIRSITDVPAARGWTQPAWVLNREAVSLEELEHRLIRERFHDARVHFALCHGALGSPPLRPEPYTGDRLVDQMNEQAYILMGNPRHVEWVPGRVTLRLNHIFDRYRSDFADSDRELVRALLPWLPAPVAAAFRTNPAFRVEYLSYDWRLNGTW